MPDLSASAKVTLDQLRHIHYRLGQSLMDVLQDPQIWMSLAETIAIIVFLTLAYKKYKELRSKDNNDKPHELFG